MTTLLLGSSGNTETESSGNTKSEIVSPERKIMKFGKFRCKNKCAHVYFRARFLSIFVSHGLKVELADTRIDELENADLTTENPLTNKDSAPLKA